MRSNEEIIKAAERSRSMMDFYMIQLEILLDIRNLAKQLVETGGLIRRTGAADKLEGQTGR